MSFQQMINTNHSSFQNSSFHSFVSLSAKLFNEIDEKFFCSIQSIDHFIPLSLRVFLGIDLICYSFLFLSEDDSIHSSHCLLVPPRFIGYYPLEGSISSSQGSTLNLFCDVLANPPVNITWIFTNQTKFSQSIRFERDQSSLLNIFFSFSYSFGKRSSLDID